MNRLSNRLLKLESVINPKRLKVVRVIQAVGETEGQVLKSEGIKDLENTYLIVRKIIEN